MDLVAFEAGAKKNCPIYEFLGLSVLEAENGVFKATIPNSKEAGNTLASCTQAYFSHWEFLGGLITARYLDNPRKFQPVVRDLKIDFKAPAMTDITATAYLAQNRHLK